MYYNVHIIGSYMAPCILPSKFNAHTPLNCHRYTLYKHTHTHSVCYAHLKVNFDIYIIRLFTHFQNSLDSIPFHSIWGLCLFFYSVARKNEKESRSTYAHTIRAHNNTFCSGDHTVRFNRCCCWRHIHVKINMYTHIMSIVYHLDGLHIYADKM